MKTIAGITIIAAIANPDSTQFPKLSHNEPMQTTSPIIFSPWILCCEPNLKQFDSNHPFKTGTEHQILFLK